MIAIVGTIIRTKIIDTMDVQMHRKRVANGLDALESDLKKRGAYNIPVRIDDKALQEFTDNAKNMMLDTILILASVTLHDEFGFGRERLNRFKERFNFKAECIGENYTDWNDQISILKEECGLEYSIRMNEKDVRLK